MGHSSAEIIDLTGSDCVDAPTEGNSQPNSTKSPPHHSPNIADSSRLPDVHDAKKAATQDDPIVISDEDPSANVIGDYGRRKRHRSMDIAVRDSAVAVKNSASGRVEVPSKDAGAVHLESAYKRRKRQQPSKHNSLESPNGTAHATRREELTANDKGPIDPRVGANVDKILRQEKRKLLRQQRREDRRAARDADLGDGPRDEDLHMKDAKGPELFVLDYGQHRHTPLPDESHPEASTSKVSPNPTTDDDGLILPSHVSIAAGLSNETPTYNQTTLVNDSEDEDFIQYLDYDDVQRGVTRYFDEGENEKQSSYACKHCGAEGDHKTLDCPVIICLTCGARNEHSTRGCPISKTCFTCGIKGHINKDCPNRFSSHRVMNVDRMHDCQRCGSDLHTAKECPTLWRMYEYVSDSRRDKMLKIRRGKEGLLFGEGGEGFIGEDLWCYNCGDEGHLGDDCNLAPRPLEFPREPSAFGRFNILSGPFADTTAPTSSRSRRQREWEIEGYFDDGYGFSGPSDVGKRGRDKEKERMRQRANEARSREGDDDEDDWFGSRGGGARRSHPPPLGPKRSKDPPTAPRGMRQQKPASAIILHEDARPPSGKKPTLSDRIERGKGKSDNPSKHGGGQNGHSSSSKGKRDREREREREKESQKNRSGGVPKGPRHGRDRDNRSSGHDSASARKYYGSYGT